MNISLEINIITLKFFVFIHLLSLFRRIVKQSSYCMEGYFVVIVFIENICMLHYITHFNMNILLYEYRIRDVVK